MKVRERLSVVNYLEKHQLTKQYVKAKLSLESDNFQAVQFRKREPRDDQVYYFR